MPQSLAKVLLHLVFSTKNRHKSITPNIQPKLYAYLAGACRQLGSEAYRVGGTEDHIHIACELSRTMTISKLILSQYKVKYDDQYLWD
ncbi:MAG: transposase [Planctomycetes bacterium]|nr:transposase [Planctomycetota bacterium]